MDEILDKKEMQIDRARKMIAAGARVIRIDLGELSQEDWDKEYQCALAMSRDAATIDKANQADAMKLVELVAEMRNISWKEMATKNGELAQSEARKEIHNVMLYLQGMISIMCRGKG